MKTIQAKVFFGLMWTALTILLVSGAWAAMAHAQPVAIEAER